MLRSEGADAWGAGFSAITRQMRSWRRLDRATRPGDRCGERLHPARARMSRRTADLFEIGLRPLLADFFREDGMVSSGAVTGALDGLVGAISRTRRLFQLLARGRRSVPGLAVGLARRHPARPQRA